MELASSQSRSISFSVLIFLKLISDEIRFTFSLACRLFVSVDDEIQVERLSRPFEHIVAGIISLPIDLPGTPFNRAIKASNFIRKELVAIVRQRKWDLAEGKASPTQDILSHMLLTCDENGFYMNESDIADKILGLLIGGHDTTSVACTFILKFLAELPHVYDGVYAGKLNIYEKTNTSLSIYILLKIIF